MPSFTKQILSSTTDQISTLKNSGLSIPDEKTAEAFLCNVNYYRLRGFLYPFYDNTTKTYTAGTNIETVIDIYHFNEELSLLLAGFISKIEIALRAHFISSMLITNDAMSYLDPSYFETKEAFWSNLASVSKEINRSSDIFIKHHFDKHEGQVPIWAAMEVVSFSTLSKMICSLGIGKNNTSKILFQDITAQYSYRTTKNIQVSPGPEMFSSWLQCVVLVRNICAHNSRLYGRSITKKPTILQEDKKSNIPQHYGIYEALLAMKYLRPSDSDWKNFTNELSELINRFKDSISLPCLNFPSDWETHFNLSSLPKP